VLLLMLAACGAKAPPAPSVDPTPPRATEAVLTELGKPLPRTHPSGRVTAWPLASTADSDSAQVEQSAGSTWTLGPLAHDQLWITRSGYGRVQRGDELVHLGRNDVATFPAGTEVTVTTQANPFVAWVVVTGPGVEGPWRGWPEPDDAEADTPWTRATQVGPIVLLCGDHACQMTYRGQPVGSSIWSHGDLDDVLTPLGGGVVWPYNLDAWLVHRYAGDGCPSLYEAVCLPDRDQPPIVSEGFGNCTEPVAVHEQGAGLTLVFDAHPGPDGPLHDAVTVAVNPRTCELEVHEEE